MHKNRGKIIVFSKNKIFSSKFVNEEEKERKKNFVPIVQLIEE